MRDLIEKAERAVAGAETGEFAECSGTPAPSLIWLVHVACGETVWAGEADPNDDGEPSVPYVQLTSETFAALKLFASLRDGDAALVERIARGIHDAPDMADTVWPDAENDDGYRGNAGHVRLCRWPDLYRDTARAVMQELVR